MNSKLRNHLTNIFEGSIKHIQPVSGGDISDAACIETATKKYFVKYNVQSFLDNFQSEKNGLDTLRGKSTLAIPEVVLTGSHGENSYLILQYIDSGLSPPEIQRKLGYGLAELHKNTQPLFGYERDNYIGSLNQSNTFTANWDSFYGHIRLEPLFRQGYDYGIFNSSDKQNLASLINRLGEICPDEAPALIHGDLWSGNWMSSGDQPYLIDPSVSFAHRELDLAMTRLFGGFNFLFYEAYSEMYPVQPQFEERVDVYQLYYLLVHAILFSGGYIQSVKQILRNYGS